MLLLTISTDIFRELPPCAGASVC